MSSLYRLSPDLVLERFTDTALILLSSRDRFVTVNQAAADVLVRMQRSLGDMAFSSVQLATLLRAHYRLSQDQALREAGDIVASWMRQGILIDSQPL
jgi:hypothetical protein